MVLRIPISIIVKQLISKSNNILKADTVFKKFNKNVYELICRSKLYSTFS